MRAAGCTYLYIGIESLAESVIVNVDKYKDRENGSWEQQVTKALTIVHEVGIDVGSSVLFGLDGETRETIEHTIAGIERLIQEGLLCIVSPNIVTYHPGTRITKAHGMAAELDYSSTSLKPTAPYVHFEEAFPGVVSKLLSVDDIWHIDREADRRWPVRNRNQMKLVAQPDSLPLSRVAKGPGYCSIKIQVGEAWISGSARLDASYHGAVIAPESVLTMFEQQGVVANDVNELECNVKVWSEEIKTYRIKFDGNEYVIGRGAL